MELLKKLQVILKESTLVLGVLALVGFGMLGLSITQLERGSKAETTSMISAESSTLMSAQESDSETDKSKGKSSKDETVEKMLAVDVFANSLIGFCMNIKDTNFLALNWVSNGGNGDFDKEYYFKVQLEAKTNIEKIQQSLESISGHIEDSQEFTQFAEEIQTWLTEIEPLIEKAQSDFQTFSSTKDPEVQKRLIDRYVEIISQCQEKEIQTIKNKNEYFNFITN